MSRRMVLLILLLTPSLSATGAEPCQAARDAGEIRDFLKRSGQPPNRIPTMSFRYWGLQATLDGRQRTGIPLVAFRDERLYPAGETDDIGLMWIVPALAATLGTGIATALDAFLVTVALLGFGLGCSAFFLLFKGAITRIAAIGGLVACLLLSLRVGDVYSVQAAALCGLLPWVIYLYRREPSPVGWLIAGALGGIALGFVHLIRSHGATSILIFSLILLLCQKGSSWRMKSSIALVMAGAFALPIWLCHIDIGRRNSYLLDRDPQAVRSGPRHPFWHSAYLGFGYLPNRTVAAYLDEVAVATVCSNDRAAHYMSADYENILRQKTASLLTEEPGLVVSTLLAKVAVLALVMLISANIGIVGAWRQPMEWPLLFSFAAALGFNSLFVVIAIPDPRYLLAFATTAILFGIVGIGDFLGRPPGKPSGKRLPS